MASKLFIVQLFILSVLLMLPNLEGNGGDLFVMTMCALPEGSQSKCSFGELDAACPNKAFECSACKGDACNDNGMLQLKKSGAEAAAAPLPAFAALLLLFSRMCTFRPLDIPSINDGLDSSSSGHSIHQ
uniref:Uncharacterized protein n=1 Tax=Globodera rostochiensis TaxID=31243 RepID=A0A914I5G3_GLORO